MVLPVPHYVWRILASAFSSVNLDFDADLVGTHTFDLANDIPRISSHSVSVS